MCRLVVSQSMYFPWPGFFNMVQMCEKYVRLDDVQFTKGFYNRVKIGTADSSYYLSVPLKHRGKRLNIDEVEIDYSEDWVASHRDLLARAYAKNKFFDEMIDVFDSVHAQKHEFLGDLSFSTIDFVCKYLGIHPSLGYADAKDFGLSVQGGARIIAIAERIKSSAYISGWGGLNYLQEETFIEKGIELLFMNYRFDIPASSVGIVNQHHSILEAISVFGTLAKDIFASDLVPRREALRYIE
jgi:pentatricopeptide repeat protein